MSGSLKHHDWIIVGQVHSCGIGLFTWLGSLRKIVFISLLSVHLWAIMLLSFQQVHSSQRLIDSLSMIHLVFLGTIISQGSLFANSFNINIRGSLLIQLQYHNTRFTRKRRLIWISDSLYSWCFKEKIRCKKIYDRLVRFGNWCKTLTLYGCCVSFALDVVSLCGVWCVPWSTHIV